MKKAYRYYERPQLALCLIEADDLLNASGDIGEEALQLNGGNDDAWNVKYR